MAKERVLYEERYKKGHVALPKVPNMKGIVTDGVKPVEAYLLGAGTVERTGGEQLEYQDIRVYFDTSGLGK